MSYKDLYDACQTQRIPVSRGFIRPKACELAGLTRRVRMQATGALDPEKLRGFIVFPGQVTEGPFVRWASDGPIILVSRSLNYCWMRFVIVKELMHLFDKPLERTSTPEEFIALLSEFEAREPVESDAMHAEVAAFWMALGLLCPEEQRQHYARERLAGRITDQEIAEQLKIPAQYVPSLFVAHFKKIISRFLDPV